MNRPKRKVYFRTELEVLGAKLPAVGSADGTELRRPEEVEVPRIEEGEDSIVGVRLPCPKVGLAMTEEVRVGVLSGVGVGVLRGIGEGVFIAVGVGVLVGLRVMVGSGVGPVVGAGVGVGEGVLVISSVGVGVGVVSRRETVKTFESPADPSDEPV